MEKKEDFQNRLTTSGLPLKSNFWDNQYLKNETAWDLQHVSPPLKLFIDSLTDKSIRILIPGCGNAYEAEYLLNIGFTSVTLIDISSALVNRLKEKFEGKPIEILHEDFFEHRGKYDLILEQTFFCAINPSLRTAYTEKAFNLLNEKGRIAGLLFNIEFGKTGPPFGGKKEEYVTLFEPLFHLLRFDISPYSVKPRMGNELFIEIEKKKLPF